MSVVLHVHDILVLSKIVDVSAPAVLAPVDATDEVVVAVDGRRMDCQCIVYVAVNT